MLKAKAFLLSPAELGVLILLKHTTEKARRTAIRAILRAFFNGGDDGSRTRVQKEVCKSISGCSLSLGFPRLTADKQAVRVGSFMSS